MKKTFGILLALALAAGLYLLRPERASAATYSGSCGSGVNWSLNAGSGALVISGSGAMTEYSYALDPLGHYVTTAPWGNYAALVKSVTVGGGVTNIGSGAFCGCANLASASLGGGVTRIGQGAFYDCASLESIALPDAVTGVEWCAFYGCVSLSSVTGGEGLAAVDGYAFAGCEALTAFSFPANVKTVGERAFSGCTGLLSVTVPAGLTDLGADAFSGCAGLSEVRIADLAAWAKIRFANEGANPLNFAHRLFCDGVPVTDPVIPNEVKAVSAYAFCGAGFTSVRFSEGVEAIGEYAFAGAARKQKELELPRSLRSVGAGAFYNWTSLRKVRYPGTEDEWDRIDIEEAANMAFFAAEKVFSDSVREVWLVGLPDKEEYEVGEPLDLAGLEFSVTYENGAVEYRTAGFAVYGFDSSKGGRKIVTVECEGFRFAFSVTVIRRPVSLSVKTPAAKTRYRAGETFSAEGLTLNLTYNDGTTAVVSGGFTVSGVPSYWYGSKRITIGYAGLKTDYEICYVDDDFLGICGRTVVFGSAFSLRYLVPKDAYDAALAAGMTLDCFTVTVNGATRDVSSALGSDRVYTENGVSYYYVTVEGISPKDIDTEIALTLEMDEHNGGIIYDYFTDSVRSALVQISIDADTHAYPAALVRAANATLAYCDLAARAFGKDVGAVYDPVPDVTTYAPIANVVSGSGAITFCGTSILLKDELAIKFWARRGSYTGSLEKLTVKINGKAVAAEKAGNGDYLTFKINVPVNEAKTAMTIELFSGGASVSNRYTDSVLNYALSMTGEDAALGRAIVNYIHYSNALLA